MKPATLRGLLQQRVLEGVTGMLTLTDAELLEIHERDPTALAFLASIGERTADQLRTLADVLENGAKAASGLRRAFPATCH